MNCLLILGPYGSGKSQTLQILEQKGFRCCDNLPLFLLSQWIECEKSNEHLAVACSLHTIQEVEQLKIIKRSLAEKGYKIQVVYLECRQETLICRLKEHRIEYIVDALHSSFSPADLDWLAIKSCADIVLDTSYLSPLQLKQTVEKVICSQSPLLQVRCMSFGIKYGSCLEADLLFDVRCLPNPYYIAELKSRTGLDPAVRQYVMQWPDAKTLLNKIEDLVSFLLPRYQQEGRSFVTVAMCCTGGKHRSVSFAEEICAYLQLQGYDAFTMHRDLNRQG